MTKRPVEAAPMRQARKRVSPMVVAVLHRLLRLIGSMQQPVAVVPVIVPILELVAETGFVGSSPRLVAGQAFVPILELVAETGFVGSSPRLVVECPTNWVVDQIGSRNLR